MNIVTTDGGDHLFKIIVSVFFIHKIAGNGAQKKGDITMEKKEKSAKELKAMEKVKRANAELAKIRRDERKAERKSQDHHKFMMGGIIVKYFPNAYDYSEQEMNRIIACAFKNQSVLNMISVVARERHNGKQEGGDGEPDNED